MKRYNPQKIEKKWQKSWNKKKINQPNLAAAKKPFYNLMMFPYPSAEGMHTGNMYAFVHSDAYGRFKKLQGYNLFEPIGLDGFGIHSENYAIKIGEHIKNVSKRTEKNFYEQLHKIGNAYDWSRTVETYKSDYYKWTQWLFLKMFEKGLAYRKKSKVNWCPSCKTVLSDEQIISGKCERCETTTEKREMEQWFWKITDYVERLLKNLEWMDWTEEVKTIQKNWIGKSEGAEIKFKIKKSNKELNVFTTRPDTLFGCTYMVLAPEHNLLSGGELEIKNRKEVDKYIKKAKNKSDLERTDLNKNKTGVCLEGVLAVNPVSGKEVPIFVADYVLTNYGTGAIMAVPAHDERDFEFAKKYNLKVKEVIKPVDKNQKKKEEIFTGFGILKNSGKFSKLSSKEAVKKITKEFGKKKIEYKLQDWCISRQRYWGPPIPMVYCEKCGWVPVPENKLPVKLPEVENFLPDGSGKGPLNKVNNFVNTKCPKCGGRAKRETDVSDPFVDSSWYYLRYLCTDFKEKAFDKKRLKKWMPVDMYIGGKEHSVLHLLYSRFVSMILFDLGYLPEEEPFKKFRAHGLLIKEGAKMSKSKGNIINPDEYIEKYGADSVRLYLMFLGDMRRGGDWQDDGMKGMYRFANRLYGILDLVEDKSLSNFREVNKVLHKTIKGVQEDMENLKYNTAISKLMVLTNKIYECGCNKTILSKIAILLAPFAPHLSEELWSALLNKDSVFKQRWPKYKAELVEEKVINVAIQINGKVRAEVKMQRGAHREEVFKAIPEEVIKKWIGKKKILKKIYIPGKIFNIVIR